MRDCQPEITAFANATWRARLDEALLNDGKMDQTGPKCTHDVERQIRI